MVGVAVAVAVAAVVAVGVAVGVGIINRSRNVEIGKFYLVRGGAKDYVGLVVALPTPFTAVLEQAAWVAESGRWHEFLRDGRADGMEIEPCGPGRVGLRWEEWFEWPHPLFTEAV